VTLAAFFHVVMLFSAHLYFCGNSDILFLHTSSCKSYGERLEIKKYKIAKFVEKSFCEIVLLQKPLLFLKYILLLFELPIYALYSKS